MKSIPAARGRATAPALAAALAVSLLVTGCGSDEPDPAPSSAAPSSPAPSPSTTTEPTTGPTTEPSADPSATAGEPADPEAVATALRRARTALERADTGSFTTRLSDAEGDVQTKEGVYRISDESSFSTTVVNDPAGAVTTRTIGIDDAVYTQVDRGDGLFEQCWIEYDAETIRGLTASEESGAGVPDEVTTFLDARADGERVTARALGMAGSLGTRFVDLLGLKPGGEERADLDVAVQDGVPLGWRTTLAALSAAATGAGGAPNAQLESFGDAVLEVRLADLGSPVELQAPPAPFRVPFDTDTAALEAAVRTCETAAD